MQRLPYGVKVLLTLLLYPQGASCGSALPRVEQIGPLQPPTTAASRGPEAHTPKRDEWLAALLNSADGKIDLIETTTVLTNSRADAQLSLSAIPDALAPYLNKVNASLPADADAERKIRALNEIVLPAIDGVRTTEFRQVQTAFPGGGLGHCVPNTLLYLIAADAVSLNLEVVYLPHHVCLRYTGPKGQRMIETTMGGVEMSMEQYREFITSRFKEETFPEDEAQLKLFFGSISRREFISLLLCQPYREQSLARFEEECRDAARVTPTSSIPSASLAGRYGRENLERAEELIHRAIVLAPFRPGYYACRGAIRSLQNKPREALQDYEAAIALAPHWPYYHYDKAGELLDLEKPFEAMEALSRAIELGPTIGKFRAKRGELYKQLKQYKEAIADLTRAVELEPKDADAYSCRAEVWAHLGNEPQYEEDRRKAAELKSNEKR